MSYGHPATVNSPHGAATMRTAALGVVGEAGVKSGRDIMTMGGEDFSYVIVMADVMHDVTHGVMHDVMHDVMNDVMLVVFVDLFKMFAMFHLLFKKR